MEMNSAWVTSDDIYCLLAVMPLADYLHPKAGQLREREGERARDDKRLIGPQQDIQMN